MLPNQGLCWLLMNGKLHPRFKENGESLKIRNGVGVNKNDKVVFAISRDPVSFGSFARLFRDLLQCSQALYLDGTISALYAKDFGVIGGFYSVGPLLLALPKINNK